MLVPLAVALRYLPFSARPIPAVQVGKLSTRDVPLLRSLS